MSETMKKAGYIPASEAAKAAGVAVQTIYKWIEGGKVVGAKSADHWYVKADSLAEYIGPIAAEAAGLVEVAG